MRKTDSGEEKKKKEKKQNWKKEKQKAKLYRKTEVSRRKMEGTIIKRGDNFKEKKRETK